MKRVRGIIVAFLVALALAAPAAAQPAADAWQAWTWSSVVERLTGWAVEALSVFGSSETTTDDDEPAAPTEDPVVLHTDDVTRQETEGFPHIDPNG